jgi:hypothetical protein
MSVNVVFPDTLLVATRQDKTQLHSSHLLHPGASVHRGQNLPPASRRKFWDAPVWSFMRLSDNGFAVIDYAEEDLDTEHPQAGYWRPGCRAMNVIVNSTPLTPYPSSAIRLVATVIR